MTTPPVGPGALSIQIASAVRGIGCAGVQSDASSLVCWHQPVNRLSMTNLLSMTMLSQLPLMLTEGSFTMYLVATLIT